MSVVLAMPLRTEDGESARTTIFIDAKGTAIGGCYGDHHREHAELSLRPSMPRLS